MSFLNPAAFFGAVLAVPIVIFYFLKVRPRRVPVATTMFWDGVFEEKQQSRALWKHWQSLFSLLLQLLFLGLVVCALADPVWTSDVGQQRRIVVVLDDSASMQALGKSGRQRFQDAVGHVGRLIASMRDRDEMAIVRSGGSPAVHCGLTSHPNVVRSRLSLCEVTDSPTHLFDGIKIARTLLAEHPQGQLVVITDRSSDNESGNREVWINVGCRMGNVAITEFQVRRNPGNPLSFETLLEVANLNDVPVVVSTDLTLNDRLLDVVSIPLKAGEVRRNILTQTLADGGVVRVSIAMEDPSGENASLDGLTVDNIARAILSAQRRIPVTLVSEGSWFLQHVLEANELIDLTVSPNVPQDASTDSILVLTGKVPDEIPAGPVLVIAPEGSTDLWEDAGGLKQPLVGEQDVDSPLLQFVQLNNVVLSNARQITPTQKHETLVEAVSGAPLYTRFARESGDVLVLSVSLNEGDLPLRTAFPILVSNALNWLSGMGADFVVATKTGVATVQELPDFVTLNVDSSHSGFSLTSPSGKVRVVNQNGDRVAIPALDEAGIWTIRSKQSVATHVDEPASDPQGSVLVACNLANAVESDLRQSEGDDTPLRFTGSSGRPLWIYAAVAALILLAVEWLLFQRRWIK